MDLKGIRACDIIKKQGQSTEQERLAIPPKGGDAMSTYETIIVILTFVGLMIVIADKFSQRK